MVKEQTGNVINAISATIFLIIKEGVLIKKNLISGMNIRIKSKPMGLFPKNIQ